MILLSSNESIASRLQTRQGKCRSERAARMDNPVAWLLATRITAQQLAYSRRFLRFSAARRFGRI
jgi:hypothetical protein